MKTERYKADYPLPPAFYRLERNPILKHRELLFMLQQVSSDEMAKMREQTASKNNGRDLCGIPTYVAISAGNMHLLPTPDDEMEIEVVYTQHPTIW